MASLMRRVLRGVGWAAWLLVLTGPLAWLVAVKVENGAAARWEARGNEARWTWVRETIPAELRENGGRWLRDAVLVGGLLALLWAWGRPGFARWRARVAERAVARHPVAIHVSGRAALVLAVILLLLFPRLISLFPEAYRPGKKELDWIIQANLYVVLALGLNIIVGMAGLLVLGYAAFYAIGAYTLGILAERMGYFGCPEAHFNHWVAFPTAVVVATLCGLVLGLPSLRLRGDYLAIVTLGFGESIRYLFKNWPELTGGEQGISIKMAHRIPREWGELPLLKWTEGFPWISWQEYSPCIKEELAYYLIFAIALVTVVAIHRLNHSRLGRALIALREDEVAAESMGIPTTRMKLLAFALSSAWGGVAGVFYAAYNGYVSPETFTFDESVLILSMVVLGGMGSTSGVILGAVILYFVPVYLRDHYPAFSDYRKLVFAMLMVAMMIFRPQGLLGGSRRKVELEQSDTADTAPAAQPAGT